MGSLFLALSLLTAVAAAPLFLNASVAPPPPTVLPIAPSTSPSGQQLSVDSASFRLNVQPVVPFAGEYHFSRVPREAWASDLAKIKAGGLTAVSAYVFWLHVEEVQGDQSWTGRNDLGAFLDAAFGAGLWVELRIGPWAHGEARNGGFPDWVQASGTKLRSNTPAFLALVQGWYTQVAAQLVGRYWSDGGAIMSVQLDNETPDVDYLMALRALAIRSGINPFMFVKTGWPTPDKAWPLGALMPSFGGYSDQFWARDLEDDLSTTFLFSGGGQPAGYPFFTVEVGGGMMSSYHRRIHIQPAQVAASAMVILASGTNQLGSYMFVGSSHPKGKLTTMMEQQGVGEGAYNDMPVRTCVPRPFLPQHATSSHAPRPPPLQVRFPRPAVRVRRGSSALPFAPARVLLAKGGALGGVVCRRTRIYAGVSGG
jgi:beta-galactosidase